MGTRSKARLVAIAATAITLSVVTASATMGSPSSADDPSTSKHDTTTSKYDTTTTKYDTTTTKYDTTTTTEKPTTTTEKPTTTTTSTTTSTTTTSSTTTTVAKPPSGCTPGFWKNHLDSWAGTGFAPGQLTGSVFDQAALYDLDDETLLQSLQARGGRGLDGAARILLRAAVASLLNSTVADVSFPMSSGEIIDAVNDALASGDRSDMLALASELDRLNNAGDCLLS